ncbi:MAG: peptide chain release factor N(5)-glutamine methyltransferase [Bacteroidetes bacterium]|nr:peptide chain release factor N(5)-glutamine methyltransferase [Bacteroidota bacterium]MBS1648589.1 peptide chain release factor N(5)-glutamine methyltransferase [Bacteroidota bacterium]
MLVEKAYQNLITQLQNVYENNEAFSIANWAIEHISQLNKIDRLINKQATLNEIQIKKLTSITNQLLQHKPIQYILNECWFAGMKLYVDENVLIPRPETEELANWIIEEYKTNTTPLIVIDIGTGSGCIPISIKKSLPILNIHAIDVSNEALVVAKKNASIQNTNIHFKQNNFLDETNWNEFPKFDIIVSNPPYIAIEEKNNIPKNVMEYEPHVALFAPSTNALIFYEKIVAFATTHLNNNGKIFVEINEALGKEVVTMFQQHSFNCELKKDLQGKDRMIKAVKH